MSGEPIPHWRQLSKKPESMWNIFITFHVQINDFFYKKASITKRKKQITMVQSQETPTQAITKKIADQSIGKLKKNLSSQQRKSAHTQSTKQPSIMMASQQRKLPRLLTFKYSQ